MKVYIFDKLDSDFRIDHYSGIGFPQGRLPLTVGCSQMQITQSLS